MRIRLSQYVQQLSYRKQIACQLRIQYVEGVYVTMAVSVAVCKIVSAKKMA